MLFSDKLKELRLQNNLTQEQLARRLDITRRTYIYYETGKKYPSVKLLASVAEFFNVSISFLVDEQKETTAQEQVVNPKKLEANQLVKEIVGLLSGGELSEIEKDALMKELQEVCEKVKQQKSDTQFL